jgi:hypothetical protein
MYWKVRVNDDDHDDNDNDDNDNDDDDDDKDDDDGKCRNHHISVCLSVCKAV